MSEILVDQKDLFNAEFFKQNRQKLKSIFIGSAPIVITANGLLQQSMDTTFPFKQDGNFWYLTGINQPDIVLVIDKDKEYLIAPIQSQSQKNFDGELDYQELSKLSGIGDVLDNKTGWKRLAGRLSRAKHFASLSVMPSYVESFGFYTNPARRHLVERINDINPGIELLDLRQHFAKLRMVKQPAELLAIKQAIAITSESLSYLKKRLDSYSNESHLEADLSYRFMSKFGTDHGFEPIVASGPNACVVHYVRNNADLNHKDLILFDVGAQAGGYSADISRTYSLSAKPSKRQKQVHQAVLEVQQYAASLLKPGVILPEYEAKVQLYMGEKLRTLGLIKTIEQQEVRKYFPHLTSHHLGYDVHDLDNYDQPLSAGNVVTVEPGIYIPEEGIGVRIEDDYLITEDGADLLSNKLSRNLV